VLRRPHNGPRARLPRRSARTALRFAPGVAERRGRIQVKKRQGFHTRALGEQLVVLADAALVFGLGAGEQDRDRVQLLIGQTTHPVLGSIGAGVAEDVRASCHALPELVETAAMRVAYVLHVASTIIFPKSRVSAFAGSATVTSADTKPLATDVDTNIIAKNSKPLPRKTVAKNLSSNAPSPSRTTAMNHRN
jgi:hypothetical protein